MAKSYVSGGAGAEKGAVQATGGSGAGRWSGIHLKTQTIRNHPTITTIAPIYMGRPLAKKYPRWIKWLTG